MWIDVASQLFHIRIHFVTVHFHCSAVLAPEINWILYQNALEGMMGERAVIKTKNSCVRWKEDDLANSLQTNYLFCERRTGTVIERCTFLAFFICAIHLGVRSQHRHVQYSVQLFLCKEGCIIFGNTRKWKRCFSTSLQHTIQQFSGGENRPEQRETKQIDDWIDKREKT